MYTSDIVSFLLFYHLSSIFTLSVIYVELAIFYLFVELSFTNVIPTFYNLSILFYYLSDLFYGVTHIRHSWLCQYIITLSRYKYSSVEQAKNHASDSTP